MLTFLKIRFRSVRLARAIRRTFTQNPSIWKVRTPLAEHCTVLESSVWRITIHPCWLLPCCRACESVRLSEINGGDIYIGPLAQIRLRNAVRLFVVDQALKRV
jgi:hypothetical protein